MQVRGLRKSSLPDAVRGVGLYSGKETLFRRTFSDALVENLSLRSPDCASNMCTTLSTVTTAKRRLLGENAMDVTLHMPSVAGSKEVICRSCIWIKLK